jgi:hypothetical protein
MEREQTYVAGSGRKYYDVSNGYQTPKFLQEPLDVYYPIAFFW